MQKIYEQAQLLQEELVTIRRELHRNPEVGRQLPQTKDFIMRKLKEYGYNPCEVANSSIVASIKGSKKGKTILLRADMDALQLKEETSLEFQSTNGAMHGCGHDFHAAMLLGAAKLLKDNQDHIHGQVKLLFQEDEEGFTGAKAVIHDGVLDNPKVDSAIALHVNSGTPSHMVLCGLGHFMAGCTLFRIEVNGVGSHGAMPEKSIDPINVATHIYLSLQAIIAREVASQDPCVLTIGKFQAGAAPNIIPHQAIMEGTIRYKNKETGERVYQRIKEITEMCAASFHATASLHLLASAPPLINNDDMIYELSDYIKSFCQNEQVMVIPQGGMGSEDFAAFSEKIPVAYLLLGAGSKQENTKYGEPMHNPHVIFNEDILCQGSAIFTICAIQWLKHHQK